MASPQQIAANRENAKLSKGPRTVHGKAQSRKNAWKHGLTARMVMIEGEDRDEFERLRADLYKEHRPATRTQQELVDHLAGLFWRFRRVNDFEAALIREAARPTTKRIHVEVTFVPGGPDPNLPHSEKEKAGAPERQIEPAEIPEQPNKNGECGTHLPVVFPDFDKLSRHEAAIVNGIAKTLHLLCLLQDRHRN